MATCNLHGTNNKAGITALLPHVSVHQFLTSVSQDPGSQSETWLEAGGITLGPLNIDTSMALPRPEYQKIQDEFLKMHDRKTRRLWFLWPPDFIVMTASVLGKCGCSGGCRFFGNNRNGPKFFKPSPLDMVEGINTATCHICTEGADLGFGQSLLKPEQLVFDVISTSMPETPSRQKSFSLDRRKAAAGADDLATPDTNTTMIEDASIARHSMTSPEKSLVGSINLKKSEGGSSSTTVTLPPMNSESKEVEDNTSGKNSIPSEFMPEGAFPDAYDTDRCVSTPSDTVLWSTGDGSVNSLPEHVARKAIGHERNHSDPHQKYARQVSQATSSGSSPPPVPRRDSRTSGISFASSAATTSDQKSPSRQSSMASPVLRRLSSISQTSISRIASSGSVSSEKFYSAAEDMNDSSILSAGSEFDDHRLLESLAEMNSSDLDRTGVSSTTISDRPSSISSSANTSNTTILQRSRRKGSSSSETGSSNSFMSALTEQSESQEELLSRSSSSESVESEVLPPNLNMVDLHGQIDQQITKSPLLMSCYSSHMSQFDCSDWQAPPPLPHNLTVPMTTLQQDPSISFTSQTSTGMAETPLSPAWTPRFKCRRRGFSAGLMISKREVFRPPTPDSTSPNKRFSYNNTDWQTEQDAGKSLRPHRGVSLTKKPPFNHGTAKGLTLNLWQKQVDVLISTV